MYLLETRNSQMKKIYELAKKVAPSSSTILILGESGTGKEVLAKYIHFCSKRKGPFVTINCAAIPEELLEAELFGYEKGAFTGAIKSKPGKFEIANKGTLFLDEIGDLSLKLQAKLLRVIQEKQVERLGSDHSIKVDVRILAATNKDLEKEVQEGRFREDLFFRLNVIPIKLPPLRERKEDIPLLTQFFLKRICEREGIEEKKFTSQAIKALLNYPWPGNIRELENFIERVVILSENNIIGIEDLSLSTLSSKLQIRESLTEDK
ncbi:MAG: sigma-54-dependent Fis family transcriptional regulator, partial [Thermodesulfobacteriota bacterium]